MYSLKTSKLLSFLVILSLCFAFVNLTVKVSATDTYTIFTIEEASSNLAKAVVYEDVLLVYNNTYILIYDLETQETTQNISLGGSVSVTSLMRKANELYLKISDGGTTKFRVYDLDNYTLLDEITDIGLTNFDGELKNLAYIHYLGIDYWGWSYLTGDTLDTESFSTYKGFDSDDFPRFTSFVTGQVQDDHTQTHYLYRLNTSDSDVSSCTDTFIFDSPAYIGFRNYFSATITPVKDSETTTYIIYSSNTWKYGITEESQNIQSRNSELDYYYSIYYTGIRERTEDFDSLSDSVNSDLKSLFVDLDESVYVIESDDDNRLQVQAFTVLGIGSMSNIYLTYDTAIDTISQGCFGVEQYIDNGLSESAFIGYVSSTLRAYAQKIVGSSVVTVGQLPASYTPDDCRVYPASKNIVALFTQSGSSDLYVCVDLIETNYLFSDWEDTNTLIGQLFKVYDSGDNLVYTIRFMINNPSYTVLASESYYFYLDGVYQSTSSLTSEGKLSASFYSATAPRELSYYVNTSGYTPTWFNITYYDSTNIDVSRTETPELSLSVTDNPTTSTLLIRTYIDRFTGESLSSTYFDTNPVIDINVKEYGLGGYYHEYDLEDVEVSSGLLSSALGYTSPNTYLVTYTYTASSQDAFLYNCTESASVSFTFDSVSKDIVIGGVVVLPTEPTTPPETPTSIISVEGILSLAYWLPSIALVLIPTSALLSLGLVSKASSGVCVLLALIGLNLGLGFGYAVGLIPFFMLVTMFLLDSLMFVFMLRSGGGSE